MGDWEPSQDLGELLLQWQLSVSVVYFGLLTHLLRVERNVLAALVPVLLNVHESLYHHTVGNGRSQLAVCGIDYFEHVRSSRHIDSALEQLFRHDVAASRLEIKLYVHLQP